MVVLARFAARVSSARSLTRSANANWLLELRSVGSLGLTELFDAAVVVVDVAAQHAVALGFVLRPGLRERIEVVAVADVDERLAPVVHLFELPHHVVRRRERHVRAVPDFGRPLLPLRHVEDVLGREPCAGDLLDRFGQAAAIVGQVDGDRRRPGGDDAEHVSFVDQLLGDLLEQLANPAGVAEVEVQVVDEDEEDAARRVGRRPRRRQQNAFRNRRGGRRRDVVAAAAVGQRERDDFLRNAVFQNLEIVFLQVGDELAAVVANDDVGRDQFNA